jgi:hypothetical protein
VSTPTPEPTSGFAEAFLDRALPRIRKFFLVLAALGAVASIIFFRWPVTAGFILGAVVSYFNQRWLERAIEALGERITTKHSRERGGVIIFRAMLRYALIAGGAYVIFNFSLAGLYGFLGGMFLPIGGIACEIAVELFVALRR